MPHQEAVDLGVLQSSRRARVRRVGTVRYSRGVWLTAAASEASTEPIDPGLSADTVTALYWQRDCIRAFAALAGTKDAFLCGLSAAWWLTGGRVRLPARVDIGVSSSRGKALGPHQLALLEDERIVHNGVPCTSPSRTACDILRLAHRVSAICAVDALANGCLVKTSEIATALERRKRQRGVACARGRLIEIEPNSGSAQETVLRLALVDGGLPRPVAQLIMTGVDRTDFLGRADLGYEALRLAIEFLGRVHRELLGKDWSRHNTLSANGWMTVGVTSEHLDHPTELVMTVLDAARRQHAALGLSWPLTLA